MKPGTLVAGRFVVDGPPLGTGLTCTVWPAWDELAARPVAIKLVHEHLVADPTALLRLQSEAGAASRLRHPSVLVVYGLWSHEGRWLLATEALTGPILAGGLPPNQVIALGLQLAAALQAIHDAGHVHGDVRPGHVRFGDRGAVLLGFGERSVRESSARPGETAPEVELGGAPSVQADLYGLGVVLHVALTGRLPWDGPTPWAILGAQQRAAPAPPDGPRGLAALVVDLLRPEPDLRPPSAADVARALRRVRRWPQRRVPWEPRWLPPVDLLRGWVVHGTDPATGAPAIVATRLSRRRAHALADRLAGQGWEVAPARAGLGLRDVGWIAVAALLGGAIVPVLGHLVGGGLALRWRARQLRPRLATALAPPVTPVPPRQEPPGREAAVLAGMLLLATALLLQVWPWGALVPLALFALLVVSAWRARPSDPGQRVLRGRVAAAAAEVRVALGQRDLALGDRLAIEAEAEEVQSDWRAAAIPDTEALRRLQALVSRAASARLRSEDTSRDVLDSLDQARAEVARGEIAPS